MSKKILIVEDDVKMKTLLVDAFKKQGFETAEASDGEAGLKMALDFKPDAILTDLMMPVMDGLTMIGRLREEAWGKDVPITILTNSDQVDTISGALERGIFKYIIKSDLSIEDIVKRVAEDIK